MPTGNILLKSQIVCKLLIWMIETLDLLCHHYSISCKKNTRMFPPEAPIELHGRERLQRKMTVLIDICTLSHMFFQLSAPLPTPVQSHFMHVSWDTKTYAILLAILMQSMYNSSNCLFTLMCGVFLSGNFHIYVPLYISSLIEIIIH